jgi:RNA polymerase sigma factor (sigma-70 family)
MSAPLLSRVNSLIDLPLLLPNVTAIARRLGLGPADAEDALQEVAIKLLSTRRAACCDVQLLIHIAHHECINQIRLNARRRERPLADSEGALMHPPSIRSEGALSDLRWKAIQQLSPTDREALERYLVYREPARTLAAERGLTVNGFRSKLRRLRARLRKSIAAADA